MKISEFAEWGDELPSGSWVIISRLVDNKYENYRVDLSKITVSGESGGVNVDLSDYVTKDSLTSSYYNKAQVDAKLSTITQDYNEIQSALTGVISQ